MNQSESANPANPAKRVVLETRDWIGTPYRHQASAKGIGCDCLGLVRGIWRAVEGPEPELTPAYSAHWSEVSRREQLIGAARRHFAAVEPGQWQLGDLLVFRMRRNSVAKHAGIFCGQGGFIHAYCGAAVTETALCGFWRGCIAAAFRFPSVAAFEGRHV